MTSDDQGSVPGPVEGLTHVDETGAARMVDVSAKAVTSRQAVATGRVLVSPTVVGLLRGEGVPKGDAVEITATVRTTDRTGVEMEALTAVSVAALTVVDMVKAVDKAAVITDVRVESKSGGKSGDWSRP